MGKKEERDRVKLTALLELGRNESHFKEAVTALAGWLKDRDHKKDPLNIKPEIPHSFMNFLLSSEEGITNNQIIVLREFILSGILDIETKLTFSKTLIRWNKEPKKQTDKKRLTNQEILDQVWADPISNTSLYSVI